MVRRLKSIILISILHTAAVCSSNFPCLTWEIYQDRLRFICRTTYFLKPVALIDSHEKLFANCSFIGNVHHCISIERNALIEVDYSRKYIAFTIPKLDENVNGIWTCLQDEKRLTTQMSLSKGIIDSTEIHITGTLLGTTGQDAKHALNCFSCREPDGNNVEILVNGRTEDSITYNHDTGKCNHRRGKCHPDECNCTANEFKLVFEYEQESNSTLYTCDMLFTDSFNNAKFSTFSSIVFNGEGFSHKTSSVSIIKAGDKKWNGIFTVTDTGISTGFVPTRTTQATVISGNNPVENKGGLHIPYLPLTVFAFVVGSLFAVCCVRFYLKSKRSKHGKPENVALTKSVHLTDVYSQIPMRVNRDVTRIRLLARNFATQRKTEIEVLPESVHRTATHGKPENVALTESVHLTEFSNNSAPEEQKLISRSISRKNIDSYLCDLYVTQTDQPKECIHYQGVTKHAKNRKRGSTNNIRRYFSLPLMQSDYGQN